MIKSSFKFIALLTLACQSVSAFACAQKMEQCENLTCVRKNIDTINEKLVVLLSERMEYVYQAGQIKTKNKISSATDQNRANAVLAQVEALAKEYNLPKEYVKKIFTIIVNDSTKLEQEKMTASH